jgi:hypothetical protein
MALYDQLHDIKHQIFEIEKHVQGNILKKKIAILFFFLVLFIE